MFFFCLTRSLLIRVRKTTHAGHDAEHVVVDGVHTQLLGEVARGNVGVHRQQQRGVVNARHVARARRLVVLGLDGKRVHVDTGRVRDVGVVLVRLHEVKVRALALREAVMAVEQQLGGPHAVLRTGPTKHVGVGERIRSSSRHGARASRRRIEIANGGAGTGTQPAIVQTVLARPLVGNATLAPTENTGVRQTRNRLRAGGVLVVRPDVETRVVVINNGTLHAPLRGVIAPLIHVGIDNIRALDHPHQLLDGMVEVEARLDRRARKRLLTRKLQLVNEVLVRDLGEAATLVRVQVDVIDVQRRVLEVGVEHRGHRGGTVSGRHVAVGGARKLNVDDDLVVLQGNERQRETRVAAKEKLQGDVQRRLGLLIDAIETRALLSRGERVRVTNHAVVTGLETRRQRQLVENLEPVTIVKVDALATNLELSRRNEKVTQRVNPAEGRPRNLHGGAIDLEVHAVNQITVARNGAAHTLAKVRGAVEGLLNRLHGKVGVAAIHHLEKGNLRITREINILCAVSD